MGNSQSLICCCKRKEVRVLLHGLDASGKTTILYKLKFPNENLTITPTLGFNVESILIKGYEFTAWDVGGRDKVRTLWRHYYPGTDALIFVIDSSDRERFDQSRDELGRAMSEDELNKIPFLVFCNKQDLPNAMSPEEIEKKLGVENHTLNGHDVAIIGCTAIRGEGIFEGIQLLAETIDEKHENKSQRGRGQCNNEFNQPNPNNLFFDNKRRYHNFDPIKDNITLKRFSPIKNGTECPFAKASKIWGGVSADFNISIEEQAKANIEHLIEFTRRSKLNEKLDGYCIELDTPKAREGLQEFGECVHEMLKALSDMDPSEENVMRVSYIGNRGWRFRFDGSDFFVTTFAPCYPETSSRYAFECGRAFLLLQPEASFAHYNLPPDTKTTQWTKPITIRDRARIAFAKAGRSYHVPDTLHYPVADHIVKPLVDDGVSIVKWWNRSQ